ncbi:MAG: ABC transporter ATP-binding protein [Acidobacteria bacterium]|nr:ABC transporter ATP-binding protein [Acidobacteriota bacterium]
MNDVLLDVNHLFYRPAGQDVLTDVSFSVRPGEFLAILGPNGAGKTSLIRHIHRILPLQAGRIRLQGQSLDRISHRRLATIAAYVPQAKGYVPPYRVAEFLLMSRYPYQGPFRQTSSVDERLVKEALAVIGMAAFGERYLDTLSGGERQKIYIAAAMVQDTDMVVLDEPTTFLDPHHAREIFRLLRLLNREQRKTMLMVSHEINPALQLAHRVLCLKAGRVLFWGTPEQMLAENMLATLFAVPFGRYDLHGRGSPLRVYLPVEEP